MLFLKSISKVFCSSGIVYFHEEEFSNNVAENLNFRDHELPATAPGSCAVLTRIKRLKQSNDQSRFYAAILRNKEIRQIQSTYYDVHLILGCIFIPQTYVAERTSALVLNLICYGIRNIIYAIWKFNLKITVIFLVLSGFQALSQPIHYHRNLNFLQHCC